MAALFAGDLQLGRKGVLMINHWLPVQVNATNREVAGKSIMEFRKALDRMTMQAFQSLADLQAGKGGNFWSDSMRERLVAGS